MWAEEAAQVSDSHQSNNLANFTGVDDIELAPDSQVSQAENHTTNVTQVVGVSVVIEASFSTQSQQESSNGEVQSQGNDHLLSPSTVTVVKKAYYKAWVN